MASKDPEGCFEWTISIFTPHNYPEKSNGSSISFPLLDLHSMSTSTPPKTNMTMEIQRFEDVSPNKKWCFVHCHVNFRVEGGGTVPQHSCFTKHRLKAGACSWRRNPQDTLEIREKNKGDELDLPITSMYGIFTYIWLFFMVII